MSPDEPQRNILFFSFFLFRGSFAREGDEREREEWVCKKRTKEIERGEEKRVDRRRERFVEFRKPRATPFSKGRAATSCATSLSIRTVFYPFAARFNQPMATLSSSTDL